MAKINVKQELFSLDGKALVAESGTTLTLRSACVNSLMAMYDSERDLSGEAKLKRYLLATKIHTEEEPDLSSEEISMLKELIGKAYGVAVVGPAFLILEGKGPKLVSIKAIHASEEKPVVQIDEPSPQG